MIKPVSQEGSLDFALDKIGLADNLKGNSPVLIKINLATPPTPASPRSDPSLIKQVIAYITRHACVCALAEGANGFLEQNIRLAGWQDLVEFYNLRIIDLDQQEAERVRVDDEDHYLPSCLKDYPIRIGIPLTSKRPNLLFSNNVKLFLGAVPRKMYQTGDTQVPRPKLHKNLHKSIANIYQAMTSFAPFQYFINGGRSLIEGDHELTLEDIYVGNDAVELDLFLIHKFKLEVPEYLRILTSSMQLNHLSTD